MYEETPAPASTRIPGPSHGRRRHRHELAGGSQDAPAPPPQASWHPLVFALLRCQMGYPSDVVSSSSRSVESLVLRGLRMISCGFCGWSITRPSAKKRPTPVAFASYVPPMTPLPRHFIEPHPFTIALSFLHLRSKTTSRENRLRHCRAATNSTPNVLQGGSCAATCARCARELLSIEKKIQSSRKTETERKEKNSCSTIRIQ